MNLLPFRFKIFNEVTSALFSDDSAAASKPTRYMGATSQIDYSARFSHGILTYVAIKLNPTNAVTYDFELYQSDGGATNSYELAANNLFKSWDNAVADVADCADNTEYVWTDLNIPFRLTSLGDFWFNVDWSGAPGNTPGFISLGGLMEI